MEAKRRLFRYTCFGFIIGFFTCWIIIISHKSPDEPDLGISQKIRMEKTVSELKVGEFGYAVPWAVSNDGKSCEISSDYTIYSKKGGTATMIVKRSEDGYHAYPEEIADIERNHWINGIPIKIHY